MINYLAAPMPYLIGLMGHYGSPAQLEKIGGLGEVLAVYLDMDEFKTFGMSNPALSIPDILSYDGVGGGSGPYGYGGAGPGGGGGGMDPISQHYGNPHMQPQQQLSIADILKMDLIAIMKEDKKTRTLPSSGGGGEGGSGVVGAAVKGKHLIKMGFGKLNKVTKKLLAPDGFGGGNGNSNSFEENNYNNNSEHGGGGVGEDPPGNDSAVLDPITKNELYCYNEGYDNAAFEEEIRIAFTSFFLSYIGDMKQYLRPNPQGAGAGPPSFDKELFKQSRIRVGEYENSPMFKLTVHFKESQIFEQFVKARINDLSQKNTYSQRVSPLFNLTLEYFTKNRAPFQSAQAKNVVRKLAQNRPVRELIHGVSHIRARTMSLTSNSRNEATASTALQKLVQECRESSVILVEVMSVVWERLRDSRGMQWKHGKFALQIIQELILHGPLGAVAEATDGLDRIRRMKWYENIRAIATHSIRSVATFIYGLLVNRSRLFAMRRICAQRRKDLLKPTRLVRDPRFDVRKDRRFLVYFKKFKTLHGMVRPGGGGVSNDSDLLGVETVSPQVIPQQKFQGSYSATPKTDTDELMSIGIMPSQPLPPREAAQTISDPSLAFAAPQPASAATQSSQPIVPTPSVAPSAPTPQPSIVNLMENASISSGQPNTDNRPSSAAPTPTAAHTTIAPTPSVQISSYTPGQNQQPFPPRNVVSPPTVSGQHHYGAAQQPTQAPLSPTYPHMQQGASQFQVQQPQQQQPVAVPMVQQGYHPMQSFPQQPTNIRTQPNYNMNTPQTTASPRKKPSSQFDPFA